MILVFAYGSVMDFDRMRSRSPSAAFRCVARLEDHAIAFPRRSKNGHGVASAVETPGEAVWGVVYAIPESEMQKLDLAEGYYPSGGRNNCYVREERQVYTSGREQTSLSVQMYFALPQKDPPLPSHEYKRLIVDGAKFWNLPKAYVRRLEKIESA